MVSNFLSLLERRYGGQMDQDAKEYIAFAREGAVRMDRLVLDLLDFSRIGRVDATMARHDSRALIDQAMTILGPAITESGARIVLPDELPELYASENETVRLFQNLLGNSIKFRAAERTPEIVVSCVPSGRFWQFGITDNGIGIDPQYFDKLFRIFQRLHPRERYDGTGIGLAICKRIVERHGGRIWLNSTPDQGTTFYFTLPALPPELDQDAATPDGA
jgi:light-regulated signal transduction histidine kinase (bacteriophytochrome)